MGSQGHVIVDNESLINSTSPPPSAGKSHILWIPYIVLTLLLVGMAVSSFINFHIKNRPRYRASRQPISRKSRRRTTSKKYHITFNEYGKPYRAHLVEEDLAKGTWRRINDSSEEYPEYATIDHATSVNAQYGSNGTSESCSTVSNGYQNTAFEMDKSLRTVRRVTPEGSQDQDELPKSDDESSGDVVLNPDSTGAYYKKHPTNILDEKGYINLSYYSSPEFHRKSPSKRSAAASQKGGDDLKHADTLSRNSHAQNTYRASPSKDPHFINKRRDIPPQVTFHEKDNLQTRTDVPLYRSENHVDDITQPQQFNNIPSLQNEQWRRQDITDLHSLPLKRSLNNQAVTTRPLRRSLGNQHFQGQYVRRPMVNQNLQRSLRRSVDYHDVQSQPLGSLENQELQRRSLRRSLDNHHLQSQPLRKSLENQDLQQRSLRRSETIMI